MTNLQRCAWAKTEPSVSYHDKEWGVPVHDDRLLFEFLILEGAQAGVSWETIVKERDAYRRAFDNFDPQRVARYSPARVEKQPKNAGMVRNRLKIEATVEDAKVVLRVQKEFGSFDAYVWSFVDG